MNNQEFTTSCGTVAVVGRPNVGKSTLLNRLVGQKVSIVSRRPQTTRYRTRGILSKGHTQYIFIDTPGFQQKHKSTLNHAMNKLVKQSLRAVDVVVWLIDASRYTFGDEQVLKCLPDENTVPVVVVMNKIDQVTDKEALLPLMDTLRHKRSFDAILPLSALNDQDDQLDTLLKAIKQFFIQGPYLYEDDCVTDRSARFLASELVREQLFKHLGQELPYGMSVCIDQFQEKEGRATIDATIVVPRQAHKGMVVGQGGKMIKQIGQAARHQMRTVLGMSVHLNLWVKVKSSWEQEAWHQQWMEMEAGQE